jgi:hypothetical protein
MPEHGVNRLITVLLQNQKSNLCFDMINIEKLQDNIMIILQYIIIIIIIIITITCFMITFIHLDHNV